jgi:hypothetical protein
MILSTVPGIVTLGCSGIREVSKFSSAIFADLAMRGFAISRLTLASDALPVFFLAFLCIMHPHSAEIEAALFHFARSRMLILKFLQTLFTI